MRNNKFKLANVDIKYCDELAKPVRTYLCAIGEYDENDESCTSIDDTVFYWFESEHELKSFMRTKVVDGETTSFNDDDFIVFNYRILKGK